MNNTNFLGVDTTKNKTYIILFKSEKVVLNTLEETRKVSENLLVSVEEILNQNKLELNDIDIFGVNVGPGSFTGVRIGVATIKAFNKALNKKTVCINSFEPFIRKVENGVIFLSCTKTSKYYAIVNNNQIFENGVVDDCDIQKFLDNYSCFCVEKDLKNDKITLINQYEECLIDCFKNKIDSKIYVDSKNLSPMYLQLSQAELNLKAQKND